MARPGGLPQPTITDDRALGGAVIERSLRFRGSSSTKMTRTFGTNTSNTTKTISFWMKRGRLGGTGGMQNIFCTALSGNIEGRLRINTDDTLQFEDRDASGGSSDGRRTTTRVFRDVNSWHHITLVLDSTQGTELDRAKIYVNGTQDTDFSATRDISQNYSFSIYRSSAENYISDGTGEGSFFDGYLAEINFIDGQALDASYFGFTDSQTGIWLPKRYEGTYGNNGFHLEFKDNSSTSTLGKDTSGNQNDFSITNIGITLGTSDDSMIDTPTNNFPTLNPSNRSSGPTLDWGNLYFFYDYKPASKTCRATFRLPKSGKYYWEWENNESSSNPGRWQAGLMNVVNEDAQNGVNYDTQGYNDADIVSYSYGGSIWFGTTHTSGSWDGTTRSWYRPQRCAWAVDCDTGNIWLGRVADDATTQWWASDGSATGNPSKLLNPTGQIDKDKTHEHLPFISFHEGGSASSTGFAIDVNFGQHAFKGTVPDEFKTLSSGNIPPDPTLNSIVRPQRHFNTLLWTGNGSTGQNIEGLEFKPDLLWIKKRSDSESWAAFDSIRGVNKRLYLNDQHAENTEVTMSAFGDGGFRVEGSGGGSTNDNSATYVGYCWKAGGAAVTNNDGTVSGNVSANPEAGFSLVQYTGSGGHVTRGHGLGKKPQFIVYRRYSEGSSDWFINLDDSALPELGYDRNYLRLNTSGAVEGANGNIAPSVAPDNSAAITDTIYSIGGDLNESGKSYINYLWTSIPGYSKIGVYTGNNNADGPYIHTGFRPAWVIIKNPATGSTEWYILDNKRDVDNSMGQYISTSSSAAEATYIFYDFLSNGFKLRNTGTAQNPSSAKILYMAFAEEPGFTPFGTFPNAR